MAKREAGWAAVTTMEKAELQYRRWLIHGTKLTVRELVLARDYATMAKTDSVIDSINADVRARLFIDLRAAAKLAS